MPPDNDHRSRAFLVGLEIERPGIDDRLLDWHHNAERGNVWYGLRLLVPPPYTLRTRVPAISSRAP